MLYACDDDAGDVNGDQSKRCEHEPLVQVLDPLRALEGVRGHHEPGSRDCSNHPEQSEGHESTCGVVAEIARRMPLNTCRM